MRLRARSRSRPARPKMVRCRRCAKTSATAASVNSLRRTRRRHGLAQIQRKLEGKPLTKSEPPVIPSASPRKSERVPSVTSSGGSREPRDEQRVQRAARGARSASGGRRGSPYGQAGVAPAQGRIRTATRPMSAPTDRSMPPVMMIGVSASASRPTSTGQAHELERVAPRAEVGAGEPEHGHEHRQQHARASARASGGCHAFDHASARVGVRVGVPRARPARRPPSASRMMAPCAAFSQNGLIPEKRERRAEHAEQGHTHQRPGEGAASARDQRAADDDGREHPDLEADAGVALHLREPDRRSAPRPVPCTCRAR